MGFLDSILRRRRPRPPTLQTVISRRIGKAIAALVIGGGAALFGLKSRYNDHSTKGLTVAQKQVENIKVEKTSVNYDALNAIKNFKELPYVVIKNAKVVKLLRNDNKGARHQRWIIQIEEGVTITVVHNIDLAEKVPLSAGDEIELAGELVYGDRKKDPIIHWTHGDPQKKRAPGYILLNGKKYGDLI